MEIKKEPLETYYDILEDIGKGQFATVKRATHKETQNEYAAKFIRKRRGGGRRGAKMEDIQKEIEILSTVSHRNIIRLYEVYETNREVILLLELVSGGELFEYLSEKDKLSEEEASAFIKQILDGVQHLHSKNIAHLDLKPENILLQDKNSSHVKLIDFGLSRKILPNEDNRAMMGTAEFVAPEVVSYEQLTLATDMWSIGVITYILLSGASPFLGDNQQETYHNITAVNYEFDEEYFNGTSEMAKGFIRSLLVKDKRKRATIKDCLNHPWIKPVEKKQRDLRRSSIIKTEHLKKFIARQRWKRSMRVVSLCNRLSRSLQLRRIQSTDTLGSCSEERKKFDERLKTTVHYTLSAPTRAENIIKELSVRDQSDDSGNEKTPEITDIPADYLYRIIAKRIVDDVVDKVVKHLGSTRDIDNNDNGNIDTEVVGQHDTSQNFVKDESTKIKERNLSDTGNGGEFRESNFEKESKDVEKMSLESGCLPEIFVPGAGQGLNLTKTVDSCYGNSDNEVIVLKHTEEIIDNTHTSDVTDNGYGSLDSVEMSVDHSVDMVPDDTGKTSGPNIAGGIGKESVKAVTVVVEHNDDIHIHGTELSESVGNGEDNTKLLTIQASHRKLSRSRRKLSELEDITEVNEATIDMAADPFSDNYQIIDRPSVCNNGEGTTTDDMLNATEDAIHTYTEVFQQNKGHVLSENGVTFEENQEDVCQKSNNGFANGHLLSGIKLQESKHVQYAGSQSNQTTNNSYFPSTKTWSDTGDQSELPLLPKREHLDYNENIENKAMLITDERSALTRELIEELQENRDVGYDKVISGFVAEVIETAKLQFNQSGYKKPNEALSMKPDLKVNTENDFEYDRTINIDIEPLNIVKYCTRAGPESVRDLFDIPEEFDTDNNHVDLETSISDEVKKKIIRQRLRKMSLQRRVQAKVIQVTAFTEMTRFRKLRDEKRIESFEMKVLKH